MRIEQHDRSEAQAAASAPHPRRRVADRLASAPLAFVSVALLGLLVVVALTTPINHDENQYIGAAMLAVDGRPFIDFLYLQTPLQPLLAAPVVAWWPGSDFLALRIAGALLAFAALAATYGAARLLGATERDARIAALLMASCHAFLFAAGLVRNDILPVALLAGAMAAAIAALRGAWTGQIGWPLAGLLLGAAISTKVSYAFPAAATVAVLCWQLARGTRRDWLGLAALGAGLAVGLMPTLIAWIAAPGPFVYGVYDYARTAPFDWYAANGLGWKLTWWGKLFDCSKAIVAGPILPALLVWGTAIRVGTGRRDPAIALLDTLIVAGLIAAWLPTPTWRQYFVPLLPPLFARISIALPYFSRRWKAGFAIAALIGLAPHLINLGSVVKTGSPVSNTEREARWIGRILASAPCGAIATLSPYLVLDSGRPLDRRFANGVFFYRTGDRLPAATVRAFNAITPATLTAELDAEPPAALITGYETRRRIDRIGLDGGLATYAAARGYRTVRSPYGKAVVHIRASPNPKRGVRCTPA